MQHILRQFIKEQLLSKTTAVCVCALIVTDDKKVLSVSRKDDPTKLGLVGGHVDPGETPEKACKRETEEETGLDVTKMRHVFTAVDECGNKVVTFACEVNGEIDTDEPGTIRWVDWWLLCDPDHTPYSEYNTKLFAHMGYVYNQATKQSHPSS